MLKSVAIFFFLRVLVVVGDESSSDKNKNSNRFLRGFAHTEVYSDTKSPEHTGRSLYSSLVRKQVFPSTAVSLALPGGWQAPSGITMII